MAHYGTHPRLTRDRPPPNDAVWHWFVCNGPHGERFEWVDAVLGAGGELRLLRKFISERSSAIPDFEAHARAIAVEALHSEDPVLVLKGIHVLTAVGTDEEMLLVKPLATAENPEISKHARTALFERGIKIKKK
jgi:hypothetical protein